MRFAVILLATTATGATPPSHLAPAKNYTPIAGDIATLYSPTNAKIPVASDQNVFRRFVETKKADRRIVRVASGTAVQVVLVAPRGEDDDPATIPVEIRFISGPSRDVSGVVAAKHVAFMVPTAEADKPIVRGTRPDPEWEPKAGDTVTVTSPATPAAAVRQMLEHYQKFAKAGDDVGMKQLVDKKSIAMVPKGVEVLVLRRLDFRPRQTRGRVIAGADLANQAMAAALDTSGDGAPANVLEVRFKGGPLADQVRFIPEADCARLIPKPIGRPSASGSPKDKRR